MGENSKKVDKVSKYEVTYLKSNINNKKSNLYQQSNNQSKISPFPNDDASPFPNNQYDGHINSKDRSDKYGNICKSNNNKWVNNTKSGNNNT